MSLTAKPSSATIDAFRDFEAQTMRVRDFNGPVLELNVLKAVADHARWQYAACQALDEQAAAEIRVREALAELHQSVLPQE